MIDFSKRPFNTPLRRALLLAFIQSYGWLWIHALDEFRAFHGGGGGGQDMGLGTIISAWFWAMVWGWFVCWPIARRVIGRQSVLGYLASALLQPILLYLLWWSVAIVEVFGFRLADFIPPLATLFHGLGLGMLPEGRRGEAWFEALMFLEMFGFGCLGFYFSAKDSVAGDSPNA